MFHQDCTITKILLGSLQRIILRRNLKFCKDFGKQFCKVWGDHYWILWNLNKPLTLFKGKNCCNFVRNIPALCDWIEKLRLISVKADYEWTAMVGALQTYKKFHDFMATTIVEDGDKYVSQMDVFDKVVVNFYKYDKESFLIDKDGKVGGNETAYLYIFRLYDPVLARRLWKDLKVYLGVFNKQGVEACNKKSKGVWNQNTNGWKDKLKNK